MTYKTLKKNSMTDISYILKTYKICSSQDVLDDKSLAFQEYLI
jgi:hypothetical protein